MQSDIEILCHRAKHASFLLADLSTEQKNVALTAMAQQLQTRQIDILNLNKKEVELSRKSHFSEAFIDRLSLTVKRYEAMVNSIRAIANLPDPVGRILAAWTVPSGLRISRIATPLGVIGVIYEARPNVTADAGALCFKSGNAVILRGGSECEETNRAIVNTLQQGLVETGITKDAIQYISSQQRQELNDFLKMDEYVDVIIPRGGKNLIQHVLQHSRIPVFRHLDGVCHTYIHKAAALSMAVDITCNAKMRRTGICSATETLLIDRDIVSTHLVKIIAALLEKGCEVRGDAITQRIDSRVKRANSEDWVTEYLDAIISVKVVDDLHAAIDHINRCGSHHTDAIVTNDTMAANLFLKRVNSANVMHNCSTQFADGGEFGMGAEMGIATGKLHARGPIGLEQLTTFKYVVQGNGQLRA